MVDVVLAFPAGQNEMIRIKIFGALLSCRRPLSHRSHVEKNITLRNFFLRSLHLLELVLFVNLLVSDRKVLARNADGFQTIPSLLQQHYFSAKVLGQTHRHFFLAQSIAVNIEFIFKFTNLGFLIYNLIIYKHYTQLKTNLVHEKNYSYLCPRNSKIFNWTKNIN